MVYKAAKRVKFFSKLCHQSKKKNRFYLESYTQQPIRLASSSTNHHQLVNSNTYYTMHSNTMYSKLSFVCLLSATLIVAVHCQTAAVPTNPAAAGPVPRIIWGSCPQLEPSDADKMAKAKVLKDCLDQHPIPNNITEESISKHQKNIAECALKKENWFENDGTYKFEKAESEIKKKNLTKAMETKLLSAHEKCRNEAMQMFKDKPKAGTTAVDQVQFYQSCMDFHITQACDIKIHQES